MPAPKDNQYWRLRTKHGRDRIFQTPDELAEAANEYFDWIQSNPLLEAVIVNRPFKKKAGSEKGVDVTETVPYSIAQLPKMRAMTVKGLCNFIDISKRGFDNYEKNEDFLPVVTRIRQIIDTQKFEGAAAGFLNANIIARDLGLQEKIDHTSKGEKIGLSRELSDLVTRSSPESGEDTKGKGEI